VVPGFVLTTIATSASLSLTGLPLNSTTTSPGSMPALLAGWSGGTLRMTAPVAFGRPNALAVSGVSRSLETLTPITPRTTLPLRSCGSRSRIAFIGVAKPMPMFAWL